MALSDRLLPLCDLLLGAAYADRKFKDRERQEVRHRLSQLAGGALPGELARRLDDFDPAGFDLKATAAAFHGDPEDDRRQVLILVAAINDADDEVDFAEDDYLRALAAALALPPSALAGLTIEVVRATPPPPPPPKKK